MEWQSGYVWFTPPLSSIFNILFKFQPPKQNKWTSSALLSENWNMSPVCFNRVNIWAEDFNSYVHIYISRYKFYVECYFTFVPWVVSSFCSSTCGWIFFPFRKPFFIDFDLPSAAPCSLKFVPWGVLQNRTVAKRNKRCEEIASLSISLSMGFESQKYSTGTILSFQTALWALF